MLLGYAGRSRESCRTKKWRGPVSYGSLRFQGEMETKIPFPEMMGELRRGGVHQDWNGAITNTASSSLMGCWFCVLAEREARVRSNIRSV